MALSQSVPPPERGDLQGSAFACLDFINSGWRDHRDGVREYDLLPSPEWQRKFRRRWALELEDGAAEPPLRRLLWAYIEALSAKSGRDPLEVLSWYKMELAVEMLRSMRPPSGTAQAPPSELEQLINSALVIASQHPIQDRHC